MAKKVVKKEKVNKKANLDLNAKTNSNAKSILSYEESGLTPEQYQKYVDDVYFKEEKFDKIKNPVKEVLNERLIKNIFVISVMIMLLVFLLMNINKVFGFVENLATILLPIIIGWVLTFIMAPLYNLIDKKLTNEKNNNISKFSRVIATIACVLVVLLFTIGIIFLFVPQLYSSVTRFISRSSGYVSNVQDTLEGFRVKSNNNVTNGLLDQVEKFLSSVGGNSSNIDYSAIVSQVYRGFAVSFRAVMNCFIGLIVMIYSLNMKEDIIHGFKKALFALTRKDIGQKILVEAKYAKQVFEGFFIGKALDSLIIGMICYVCCMIMGIPYTPLIAVIIGITNIIPFFGPIIGAIPSFVLILLEEPFSIKPYAFVVFILILQQIDGNIIGPKILGDKTGVGSFWVLFSIILFGGLYGFVGMIIAVPLWAVITRIWEQFLNDRLAKKHYPITQEEYEALKKYHKSLNK